MLTNKGQSSSFEILIIILGCTTILLAVGNFSVQKSSESLEQSYNSLYSRRMLDVMMNYEYNKIPLQDYLSLALCGDNYAKNITESSIKEIADYYSSKKGFNYILWTEKGEVKICDNNTNCNEKIVVKDVVEVDYNLNLPCSKDSSVKLGIWNYR